MSFTNNLERMDKMRRKVKDLKDRREELAPMGTVSEFNETRKKNLKKGYWACVCGSRKFYLLQQSTNVKAICVKCEETDIIYWNGCEDNVRMRRLDTNTWVKLTVKLKIE